MESRIYHGHGITMYALVSLKGRLFLEASGMQGRGPSAYSQAKEILGVKGRPSHQELLELLNNFIQEQGKLLQPGDIKTSQDLKKK